MIHVLPGNIGLKFDNAAFMNEWIAHTVYIFGLIFLSCQVPTTSAQNMDGIVESIQSGSSKDLGKYFNRTIALNMDKAQGDYSNNQAQLIFRDFFRKSPPNEFEIIHQDTTSDKIWYFIGKYWSNAANFKVLVKGTQEKGALSIYSIDFTRE